MGYEIKAVVLPSEVYVGVPFAVFLRVHSDTTQTVTFTRKCTLNEDKYLPDYDVEVQLSTGTEEYYIDTIEAPPYSASDGDVIEVCVAEVCESRTLGLPPTPTPTGTPMPTPPPTGTPMPTPPPMENCLLPRIIGGKILPRIEKRNPLPRITCFVWKI